MIGEMLTRSALALCFLAAVPAYASVGEQRRPIAGRYGPRAPSVEQVIST